jgi:NAD(P)-dependent dehydrogenase (short-subunit alcohol dehydrogenase family)
MALAGLERKNIIVTGAMGRIDGRFNKAGIESPVKPIVEIRPEEFDRLMAINLLGVFPGLRRMFRRLAVRAAGGVIVNTASVLDTRGFKLMVPYAAS